MRLIILRYGVFGYGITLFPIANVGPILGSDTLTGIQTEISICTEHKMIYFLQPACVAGGQLTCA